MCQSYGEFVLLVFVFFSATATTDIYTYLHTLSLHDALPICDQAGDRAVHFDQRVVGDGRAVHDRLAAAEELGERQFLDLGELAESGHHADRTVLRRAEILVKDHVRALEQRKVRSEEHTSELQSLMRISYAVFCLKKKKTQTNKYTTQSE